MIMQTQTSPIILHANWCDGALHLWGEGAKHAAEGVAGSAPDGAAAG
ncbi:MAG: hypothetical protein JNK35_07210, partial [Phycisphaerae bacterium]|nr:hypothetical protein [Phycisphaerae bacterium]